MKPRKRPVPVEHYIREWRKHRGLTIYDVAKVAALSASQIAQIERGVTVYTGRTLPRIARALGVEPWQLLASAPENSEAFTLKLSPTEEARLTDIAKEVVKLARSLK